MFEEDVDVVFDADGIGVARLSWRQAQQALRLGVRQMVEARVGTAIDVAELRFLDIDGSEQPAPEPFGVVLAGLDRRVPSRDRAGGPRAPRGD